MERQTTTVTVYEQDFYSDDNAPPENLIEFSAWLAEMFAKVPDEYRDVATIEIESDYDGYRASLTISYCRPETDDELAERVRYTKASEQAETERARQNYERLRVRFEKN